MNSEGSYPGIIDGVAVVVVVVGTIPRELA
jgi:hypothetical protein